MSKEANEAKLAMIRASKAFKENDVATAADLYAQAAKNYQIAKDNENYLIALLNQGAALTAAGKHDASIAILKQAEDTGLHSRELKINLGAAYYNLGLEQITRKSIKAAILNFAEAKKYNNTAETSYRLGDILLKNNQFEEAEREFSELLVMGLPPEKFTLELQLNSFCQLITSQEQQGKNVDEATLLEARAVFNAIAQVKKVTHSKEANFILVRLVSKYLIDEKYKEALAVFKEEEIASPGITKIIVADLEQFALYKNTNGATKEALHMLWFISESFIDPPLCNDLSEIIEHSKSQASAIVENLNKGGAIDLVGHILDGTCTHDEIDTYFV